MYVSNVSLVYNAKVYESLLHKTITKKRPKYKMRKLPMIVLDLHALEIIGNRAKGLLSPFWNRVLQTWTDTWV